MTNFQSSLAIEHMHQRKKLGSSRPLSAICYFYFTYDSDNRATQDHKLVARSILKQLVCQLKSTKLLLPETLEKIIQLRDRVSGETPDYDTVLELIASCSNQFTSVFVFFDGLDECGEKHKKPIL